MENVLLLLYDQPNNYHVLALLCLNTTFVAVNSHVIKQAPRC